MANLVEPGLVRARLLKLRLGTGLKKIGLIPPLVRVYLGRDKSHGKKQRPPLINSI